MVDLGSIDCVNLFKSYGGTGSNGILQLYQYTAFTSEPTNPYELPIPNTPYLLLEAECTSIKHSTKMDSERANVGIINDSLWRVTISGQTDVSKLILRSYAVINWNGLKIKGVLANVERKHSNRFHVFIDTTQNVPI